MPNHENLPIEAGSPQGQSPDYTISLLDIVIIFAKRKLLILIVTAVATLGAIGFSIFTKVVPSDSPWNPLPDIYTPRVQILLDSNSSSSSLSSLLGSNEQLSSLANLVGANFSSQSNAALVEALIQGDTVADQIVQEFDFRSRYNIVNNEVTTTRKILREAMTVENDSATGIMTVEYTTTDPEFATRILNRLVELIETRFRSMTMERLYQKKLFLEERLAEIQQEYTAAQQALISFQRDNGIIQLETQASAQVDQIVQLTTILYEKEIEMQNLRSYMRTDDPRLTQLQNEIQAYQRLLNELRTGFQDYSSTSIPVNMIPELAARFANLQMDLTIAQTIYSLLRQQYETTKLEEYNTMSSFQVIEVATVPELKSGPRRSMICVVAAAVGFVFSILIAFALEFVDRVKRDPVEGQKWHSIREALRFGKKRNLTPKSS